MNITNLKKVPIQILFSDGVSFQLNGFEKNKEIKDAYKNEDVLKKLQERKKIKITTASTAEAEAEATTAETKTKKSTSKRNESVENTSGGNNE